MIDQAAARGELIRYLENALAIADEIEDGKTGYLIERALDVARSGKFKPQRVPSPPSGGYWARSRWPRYVLTGTYEKQIFTCAYVAEVSLPQRIKL
jgi:hypothetical protein